jgi:site-specific DNA recombinase
MIKENNIAIYVRVGNKDEMSAKNQLDFIKDYLTKLNIKTEKIYVDDGYTGTNFDRPAFKKMTEDIKNKVIDTIYVQDLSRLGRNRKELIDFSKNILDKYDSKLILINDEVDFKSIITIMDACEELRKQDLKDRKMKVQMFRENR